MSVDEQSSVEHRADDALRAFLAREAMARAAFHPTASEASETIEGRRPRRQAPARVAVLAAAMLVGIVVLGVRVFAGPANMTGSSSRPSATLPNLALPMVAPGAACPVTAGSRGAPSSIQLVGTGPVRLSFAQVSGTAYFETTPTARWNAIETIWTSSPGFAGQATARGARLDGVGELRFGDPLDPLTTLVIGKPAVRASIDDRVVLSVAQIRVQAAGCYGVQIDTESESEVIVFRAEPISDAFAVLERPLTLPVGALGECPVSNVATSVGFVGSLLGEGPVYVTGSGHLTLTGQPKAGDSWLVAQVWVADPRELGPILVRGGRIDGPGRLKFGPGSEPSDELRFAIRSFEHTPGEPAGWRIFNQYVRPASAGCFAIQVDTFAGSSWFVFEASP
jgi:hypothetical protein